MTKICGRCREELPYSDFHKHKGRPLDLAYACKICTRRTQSAKRQERYRKNSLLPDSERFSGTKVCTKCKKELPRTDFAVANHTPSGLTGPCKDCGNRDSAAWKRANAELVNELNQRRAAQRLGNGYEPYTRKDIFERDAWVCQLCFNAVAPDLRLPDKLSATIDHITPISKGGSDTPGNVQLAHWLCNVRKGNRA